jgi:hypothetical protein
MGMTFGSRGPTGYAEQDAAARQAQGQKDIANAQKKAADRQAQWQLTSQLLSFIPVVGPLLGIGTNLAAKEDKIANPDLGKMQSATNLDVANAQQLPMGNQSPAGGPLASTPPAPGAPPSMDLAPSMRTGPAEVQQPPPLAANGGLSSSARRLAMLRLGYQ